MTTYLTAAEIAEEMRVSRSHAYAIMKECTRVVTGRRIRVSRQAFEAWKKRHEEDPCTRLSSSSPDASRWWCRIPNPAGGKHIRVSTGQQDKTAALAVWRRLCRESVQRPDKAKDETTLRGALDARIAERKDAGRAAGTIDSLTKKARQVTRVLGAETLLSSVTARDVDRFVSTRLAEGAERTTVQKELSALRGALKLARRQGYACPHLEDVMPLSFAVKYKPKERALDDREVALLLAELAPRKRAVVAFILATSATYPSEVQNVIRTDVDARKWMVRLRGTKRETRERVVPVPKHARAWLLVALHGAPKTGKLFEPWANVRRDLHDACDRAGIEHCSPNDLRRTFATMLSNRGVEPYLIAPMLGHKDSRMVERVYGRVAPARLAFLVEERIAGASQGQVVVKSSRKAHNC